jgi:hypothetical protein
MRDRHSNYDDHRRKFDALVNLTGFQRPPTPRVFQLLQLTLARL